MNDTRQRLRALATVLDSIDGKPPASRSALDREISEAIIAVELRKLAAETARARYYAAEAQAEQSEGF